MLLTLILTAWMGVQEPAPYAPLVVAPEAARLKVLFIGDRGHHQPAIRLAEVYGPMLRAGFAIDYEDDLSILNATRLASYDCVWMYANQSQHRTVPVKFEEDLRSYIEKGGGFFALHCTSGCFMESAAWKQLVGARFVSHGDEVFTQEVVAPEHPLVRGWEPFTCWDETYVQEHEEQERTILTMRGEEPWSWVRHQGKGRVYYSASGHDARSWTQPAFLDLLIRALDWCAGDTAAAKRQAFQAPVFSYREEPWVPNYEGRAKPLPLQLPSTPEQAVASLIVPAGFRAELFAAEPMVVNPVAMCWDDRGRLFVAESPDYPNTLVDGAQSRDRISILEDTDGDGRADKKTLFSDQVNLPTGMLAVADGLLVLQAPDLLFLADIVDDAKADIHRVVFSGFGRWDTHAGPSNLRWGPDNRLWGSVGYSTFTLADGTSFGSGLWSWKPGIREPRFEGQFSNNTWGLGFRSDGETFGSTANAAPSFFLGAPKPILAQSQPQAAGAAPVFDTANFHPAQADIIQGDWFGKFTSAAGFSFATGSTMPAGWVDRSAFVCAPTGHLVARLDVVADGSGLRTQDAFNLCASTDAWFCPVQAEVGPDGAIWIADFAQFVILHNLPGNPERGLPEVEYGDGNAHLNPLRDDQHGRIYRLVPEGGTTAMLDLTTASNEELVAALGHDHAFWRTAARRRIVEKERHSLAGPLRTMMHEGNSLGRIEAIRTLAGLHDFRSEPGATHLVNALSDPHPAVVQNALKVLPHHPDAAAKLLASGLLDSPSPQLRRHALIAAAQMPQHDGLGVALAGRALAENPQDRWLPQLLVAAATAHAPSFLKALQPLLASTEGYPEPNLFANGTFEQANPEQSEQPQNWQPRSYSGEANYNWVKEGGRNASRALRIQSANGADTSWWTTVSVEPHMRYRLSGWIRTVGLTHPGETHGALLNIHPRHIVTEYVHGDSDWTQVSLEFETAEESSVSINCLYGGWGQSTGEAYYDDLSLVALGPAQDLSALAAKVAKASGLELESSAPTEANTLDLLDGGNADAGRKVFFEHQVAGCFRCHGYGGEGGGIGPDLSEVHLRLDRPNLLESILDPGAKLAEGWTAPTSAMPALGPFLTEEELRDLVAFLSQQP